MRPFAQICARNAGTKFPKSTYETPKELEFATSARASVPFAAEPSGSLEASQTHRPQSLAGGFQPYVAKEKNLWVWYHTIGLGISIGGPQALALTSGEIKRPAGGKWFFGLQ